jgi:hypothetical protein
VSKHVSRKERWTQETPGRFSSREGVVVYEKKAWYALLDYKTRTPAETPMPVWESHHLRLGPFKRPRNAMVALEREATMLKNRHGPDLLLNGELWAEA